MEPELMRLVSAKKKRLSSRGVWICLANQVQVGKSPSVIRPQPVEQLKLSVHRRQATLRGSDKGAITETPQALFEVYPNVPAWLG